MRSPLLRHRKVNNCFWPVGILVSISAKLLHNYFSFEYSAGEHRLFDSNAYSLHNAFICKHWAQLGMWVWQAYLASFRRTGVYILFIREHAPRKRINFTILSIFRKKWAIRDHVWHLGIIVASETAAASVASATNRTDCEVKRCVCVAKSNAMPFSHMFSFIECTWWKYVCSFIPLLLFANEMD